MIDAEILVKSYLAAIAARDFDLARTFLADRGFNYTSPISSFKDADHFIQNISAVGQILERLDIRKCVASGNEVIVILDATLTLNGYASYTSAMLFVTADRHIKSIDAIFDASDYQRMFSSED